ncbi:hypothetical protein BKH41_02845 [Helicobacter sp. 12S02232-10]|uniref:hypothetical protein n=1 Tax=Helicobacter sp. 12S02232-10 TaxID=1476197 RepID=UPI000BA57220|nr:hypothetical protein [Helicobacter sp. 12S02232-10]PAF49618.1 hypothetical protein BKH41_02845 [Helicobacter sp. 12S02232-10]
MKIIKRSDIVIISSNLTDDTPTYNKDNTYKKDDVIQNNHVRYKSLLDNNQESLDKEAYWENLGATNDYAAFDFFLNTQSQKEEKIEIVLSAKENNALYLANLWGERIKVEVIEIKSARVLEDKEWLLFGEEITDWREYFFGDWQERRRKDVYFERSTLGRDAAYRITLFASNDTAKIGHIVCSKARELGISLYKNSLSAIDFSKIETDEQGNTSLTKGNYKKTNSFDVAIPNNQLDFCVNAFIELRGEPCVFVITQAYKSLINYAILKKWEVLLEKRNMAIASLELEGLV